MNKFCWVLINVPALFIPMMIANHKAREIIKNPSKSIKVNENIKFDINHLISKLGNKENVVDISSTISSIKIKFIQNKGFNSDYFKEFNVSGVMISNNFLTICFGNNSRAIEKLLKEKLKITK